MEELKFFKADGITPDENAQRLHDLATRIVPEQIAKNANEAYKSKSSKGAKAQSITEKG